MVQTFSQRAGKNLSMKIHVMGNHKKCLWEEILISMHNTWCDDFNLVKTKENWCSSHSSGIAKTIMKEIVESTWRAGKKMGRQYQALDLSLLHQFAELQIRCSISTKKYWPGKCCRYSLEAPHQGNSNEYLNIHVCFCGEIRKIFTWHPFLSMAMSSQKTV